MTRNKMLKRAHNLARATHGRLTWEELCDRIEGLKDASTPVQNDVWCEYYRDWEYDG